MTVLAVTTDFGETVRALLVMSGVRRYSDLLPLFDDGRETRASEDVGTVAVFR